ncbi:UDP-N-acetylmuramoyl-L-alanyl-D-glutamate--2,6-diaminopimelate ligase [Bacillus sp. FJAT-42376]|uniref:UDP-N-acetylmuramoyl-L-alanyl-D-glutamate--2, 6-diaminopimelate ligase n=1 Tax=Bacillus sp. FJAT-42376 TaxID=2014076 RepID=UPI000F4D5B9F|nr:UDP-N-acetylmuramoyl-L-alanyl-D-glutamate--2,6-diaminopimelate ligase [Bacillus sp. FJAT-42376]AZB44341.1 UDP-N-acetylmuramoyl-L-alanyl-D-glutamate--2,6-diaminopimelate ligase [Bacillus sp. FJAT-42376]
MNLHQLLLESSISTEPAPNMWRAIEISGIASDSRCVKPGNLFMAISGYEADGHEYIDAAIKAGAAAVAGERNITHLEVPYIQLGEIRKQMAKLAAAFYGDPQRKHKMIGITGTNGKTTTAFMLKHILETAGYSCSLFGTIANYINGKWIPASNTTPDSLELQKLLFSSRDEYVVMEVSSHGISQHRVEGIEFDYALFTNLDRDHLDYHHTMEEYFSVKSRLFQQLSPSGAAFINTDSIWGQRLVNTIRDTGKECFTFGEGIDCDLRLSDWKTSTFPAAIFSETENRGHFIQLSIPGLHNIFNAGLAFLSALKMGLDERGIQDALMTFPGVPGRNEIYKKDHQPTFVVDYAHTADALLHCLKTARECGAVNVYHVFGFRGGRDESKRWEMVKLSSELSDRYILTLDDLNGTKEEDMTAELENLQNQFGNEKGSVMRDRTLAIQHMMSLSTPEDWIVVTGKGAEAYQQTFELPAATDGEAIRYIQGQNAGRKFE